MKRVTDMAGLPGTGLGGLFYVLLILWMIVRKALHPGIYARWHQLLPLGGMAAAMIMTLWVEMWAVGKIVGRMPTMADLLRSQTPSATVAVLLGLIPILTLIILLISVQIARLFIPRNRPRLR